MTATARPAQGIPENKKVSRRTWWMNAAKKAAGDIPDAPTIHSITVRRKANSTYVSGPRGRRLTDARLTVSASDFANYSGTPEGKWIAVHAASAGRWTKSIQHGSHTLPILVAITAIFAGIMALSPPNPEHRPSWIIITALFAVAAIAIAVWRRRTRVQMLQLSDEQATRQVSLEAAEAVLGNETGDGIYRTSVHEWWRRSNKCGTQYRLARLRKRHATDEASS